MMCPVPRAAGVRQHPAETNDGCAMIETSNCMTDAERQAWLTSARAWGQAFPQYADLVARLEAIGSEIMDAEPMEVLRRLDAMLERLTRDELEARRKLHQFRRAVPRLYQARLSLCAD